MGTVEDEEGVGVEGAVSTTVAEGASAGRRRSVMLLVGCGAAAVITLLFMGPAFACSATDGFLLKPSVAFPGTPIEASGEGYPVGYTVRITEGAGTPRARALAPAVPVDAKGHFSVTFVVPTDLVPRGHSIAAIPVAPDGTEGEPLGRPIATNLTVTAPSNDPTERTPLSQPNPTPAPRKAVVVVPSTPVVPSPSGSVVPSSTVTGQPAPVPNASTPAVVEEGSRVAVLDQDSETPPPFLSDDFADPSGPPLPTSPGPAIPGAVQAVAVASGAAGRLAEGVPPSLAWSAVGRELDSAARGRAGGVPWALGLVAAAVAVASAGVVFGARRRTRAPAVGSHPEGS